MAPYLVFPVLMSASLGLTWALLQSGLSPAFAGLPAVLLFGFLGIFILERKMPTAATG